MVEVLVSIYASYESPEHPGLELNQYVEFVDMAPEFLGSHMFYKSLEGRKVHLLTVAHKEVGCVLQPTHRINHRFC